MVIKSLPMYSLNYPIEPSFDEWVKITNRCICHKSTIMYETGEFIMCKVCDGFIINKDNLAIINRVNRLSSGNHVVDGECLGTNLNEDIKSKIKLSDYCDCPFCSDVRLRRTARDIDEYI